MSLETLQAELYWAQQQLALTKHNKQQLVDRSRDLKRDLRRIRNRLELLDIEENRHTDAVRGIERAIIDTKKETLIS